MSNGGWELEPNAEREILLPWLLGERDIEVREKVLLYLAGLLESPFRPQLEDDERGVFSIDAVPGTHVGLTWVLNLDDKQLVLALVG